MFARKYCWLIPMSKKFIPNGVMPALVTPFTKDGDIMEEGFREVIDYTIENGATGVVPAGTTGEFVYMRTEERKKILKLTVEYVNERVPIVAGTGQNSTKATIELTKYAADIGCDAALVISPFYLRPSDKGYYEHYATVARKSDLPIILYNIPQCTLGVLNSSLVEDLAEIDNIVGIKDSSGNIPHTLDLIEKVKDKIPVLIGHDECFLSATAAGASAAILASANVIPHIWLDVMKKIQTGKYEEAKQLQYSVQTLSRIITRNGGAPPAKAALRIMGINAGHARLPLNTGGTLTRELREEIRIELEKLELIKPLQHPELVKEVDMKELVMEYGLNEEFLSDLKIGNGRSNIVSASVISGQANGPLGEVFVKLLTTPKIGYEALSIILEPNLRVRPSSLMLPMRQIRSMRQASLFYGPVQSGAAKAVSESLKTRMIPKEQVESNVMIMAMDVDLNSRDRRAITRAAEEAVSAALEEIWR
ncbi:MAG: 4-hydroxy-tetrahydrodipicolinate synthase [Candidatus Lokiarchaeota archaeon]|nr:4-hydroxy-tetrahydrodipicolinate synthase [Candidatus Lokiarchaeota archaeon]